MTRAPAAGGNDEGEAAGQEVHLPRWMHGRRSGEDLLQVG